MFCDPLGLAANDKNVNLTDYVKNLKGATIMWNKSTNAAYVDYKGVQYTFSASDYEINNGKISANQNYLDAVFKNKYMSMKLDDAASKNRFANIKNEEGYKIIGSLEVVSLCAEVNYTFSDGTNFEDYLKDLVKEASSSVIFLTGKGAGAVLSKAVSGAEALYEDETIDFDNYGGVYYRTYYARNIVDPSMQYTNAPVPYEFQYVTVYYSDSEMTDPIYVDITGDPPIRLDNMNK